ALDRPDLHLRAVELGQRLEELPARAVGVEAAVLSGHVYRLVLRRLLAVRRAVVRACAAPVAVVGRDLDRHHHAGLLLRAPLLVLETGRRAGEQVGRIDLHPDRGVRAHKRALRAVDADRRIPSRELVSDVAALPARRAYGKRAAGG